MRAELLQERLGDGWIWLEKTSPLSYAFEALAINEFRGQDFTYETRVTSGWCAVRDSLFDRIVRSILLRTLLPLDLGREDRG